MNMNPPNKPKATREQVVARLEKEWARLGKSGPLPDFLIGSFRGYFEKTMGDPTKNDRGIYDDAVFVIEKGKFTAFNINTDPSVMRKGIATLAPGAHRFRKGNHGISRPGGGYPAFRPATKNEELPVTRDGVAIPWPGVAINIHKGGFNTTSSEGCQTLPPLQWDSFYATVSAAMERAGVAEFDYILIDGTI